MSKQDEGMCENIHSIENGVIVVYPPIIKPAKTFVLSALKGKLIKQSKEDIEKQISELRGEWFSLND